MTSTRHRYQGFTLTELAIVLGIIGLILGAIWTAASKVYANNRIGKATQQVLSLLAAGKATFAGKGVITAGDYSQLGVNAGWYNSDMLQTAVTCYNSVSPCPLSPWNSNVLIGSNTGWYGISSTSNQFEIMLISGGAGTQCPGFMSAIVQQAGASGLASIYSQGQGSLGITSATAITSTQITNCSGDIVLTFNL